MSTLIGKNMNERKIPTKQKLDKSFQLTKGRNNLLKNYLTIYLQLNLQYIGANTFKNI